MEVYLQCLAGPTGSVAGAYNYRAQDPDGALAAARKILRTRGWIEALRPGFGAAVERKSDSFSCKQKGISDASCDRAAAKRT
jgi:hypothetical protein